MANGEWMNQLIAGLGGAFTGAGQARSRMAEEQEAERKRMETENERARLKRIQELRGGGFSDASARELLSLGETPGNISSLKDLFTPTKAKPDYIEGVNPQGRKYRYDPATGETITSPITEYRAPREATTGPTAGEKRAAETEYRAAIGDVQRLIRNQPRLTDKRFAGITSSAAKDTASYLQEKAGFDADTAFAMARARQAAEQRQELTGLLSILPGQQPRQSQMSPTAGAEQAEARAAQQAISRVMASGLSDAEKQTRVRAITDELNRAITEIRSGR